MSTRGTIAVVLPDGQVRSIYVHFDSYLMGVGRTLLLFWDSQELAELITSIGDMSVLGERIVPIGIHTANYPESGTCLFFGRDCGENDVNPITWISLAEYNLTNQFEEYNYLFFNGAWHVSQGSIGTKGMRKIEFSTCGTKVLIK